MKWVAGAIVLAFIAVQFIRPDRTNPASDPGLAIGAAPGAQAGLAAVLDRSCGDCHSNATVWPAAAEFAPLSWLMASAVKEGRKAVNFSEWATYPAERQRALLEASCQDVKSGKMPSVYTMVRPETRLSPRDIETVCAASIMVSATSQSR